MTGKLILLPNLLHDLASPDLSLPSSLHDIVHSLDGLFAENAKRGRRFLKMFNRPPQDFPIITYDDVSEMLDPLKQGETWGLISDAGRPCLADPGAWLVRKARQNHIPVQALSGPTSPMLALMLSGLPAQSFTFLGYLPKKTQERKRKIRAIEADSKKHRMTYMWIETPYRNEAMFRDLIHTLRETTHLGIASDLTGPEEKVDLLSVAQWKKKKMLHLHKKPAIFLLYAHDLS